MFKKSIYIGIHRLILYIGIYCLFVTFAGPSLLSQDWTALPGINAYVNRIVFDPANPQSIIVCSDQIPTDLTEQTITFPPILGKGYQQSLDGGTNFTSRLDSFSVYHIIRSKFNPDVMIAAVRHKSRGSIIKSTDGGANWLTTEFSCDGTQQIMKFATKSALDSIFYAVAVNTSSGFVTTRDEFNTCNFEKNPSIQSRDLSISPIDTSLIFIAGDKFYGGGVYRTRNGGLTWQKDSSGLEGLRVHCVLASGESPAVVYCGADSVTSEKTSVGKGIYQSLDTGKTWKRVGAAGLRVFSLACHPSNPKYLAAACDLQGVYISGNGGGFWQQFKDGFADGASVRTVAIPDWQVTADGIVVFAGTFGNRLYQSKPIKTDIRDDRLIGSRLRVISVAPQPFSDKLSVKITAGTNIPIAFRLHDILGSEIVSNVIYSSGDGEQLIDISIPAGIGPGVYFLETLSGRERDVVKIIKL